MALVREIDPHDPTAFRAWYDTLVRGATAGRSHPIVLSFESFVTSLQNPGSELRRISLGAMVDAEIVGAMLVELPLKDDLETVSVEIDVPPQHRRRGIGSALWKAAETLAADGSRTVFQAEIDVPTGETVDTWPGARFAVSRGFTRGNVEDHLVLPLPATATQAALDPGYRIISWTGVCPEEHLRSYADMQTEMSRDVPTGEMTRAARVYDVERVREGQVRLARNYCAIISVAQTAAGDPAGYSEMLIPLENEADVLQQDTLVVPRHRGNGLGAALKAANLRLLADRGGRHRAVHTWTATDNAPMQQVNSRFGFQKVEQLHEFEKST